MFYIKWCNFMETLTQCTFFLQLFGVVAVPRLLLTCMYGLGVCRASPPLLLPVLVFVDVRFQVLGRRQWKTLLAPALAGLRVWQHQQIAVLPCWPEGRHHSVTCNTMVKCHLTTAGTNTCAWKCVVKCAATYGRLVLHGQMQRSSQEVDELRQEALWKGDVLHRQTAQH